MVFEGVLFNSHPRAALHFLSQVVALVKSLDDPRNVYTGILWAVILVLILAVRLTIFCRGVFP